MLCPHHGCAAIIGGAGIATGRGGSATKPVWPKSVAARSRRDEYSFFRDHMMKPISLVNARAVLTTAVTSGHQTSHDVGCVEDPVKTDFAMKRPITMVEQNAITNQGMT